MNGDLENLPSSIWHLDGELAGALFVLDAPLVRNKAWPCIDVSAREIDWDKILVSCHSSSETVLVRAARAIWGGNEGCDLASVGQHLDDAHTARICVAMMLGRRNFGLPAARAYLAAMLGW